MRSYSDFCSDFKERGENKLYDSFIFCVTAYNDCLFGRSDFCR